VTVTGAAEKADHGRRRIALAHDWLVGLRGGERVLDRLATLFGPTDLYVLVDDGRALSPAISACRVVTSPLQRLPGATRALRRFYLPLMPWAVGRLKVAPCDLLVSTSSAVMKSIRPPAGTPHLCYCHSPARYVWEQTDDYGRGSGGLARVAGLRAVRSRFQDWDRRTSDSVTQFVANSTHTRDRIRRAYGRDATVVPPPVDVAWFDLDPAVPREDFFLVVSALEPYKRVDLAIDAANRAQLPLRIVGDGSLEPSLAARAGPTVELLGRVPHDELRDLYRRARALLFPQVEDFGLAAVEAQACGCPVIAYAAGGALDTVTPASGRLLRDQAVPTWADAMRSFAAGNFDPLACRANAERFSNDAFDASILALASELLGPAAPRAATGPS
jgi:glycosyltransferase involved in cell wall biosynthesis